MLQSFSSTSDRVDPIDAVDDVLADCQRQLGKHRPQVGLVFTSYMGIDYRPALRRIIEAFPGIKLVGCTTDSEIGSSMGFSEDSLSLTLLSAEGIEFATAVATDISRQPELAFQNAFGSCRKQLSDLPACGFVFPDGLTSIGVPLDRIIRDIFGSSFPFFGGTAGDHYELQKTWQFFGEEVYSDAAPVLLLGGPVDVKFRMVSGWTPIGGYHPIETFDKNRIFMIDGMTAQKFYEKYLGPYQPAFTDFPLAVYEPDQDDFYLRTPMAVDQEDGSIEFIGNFTEGATVRLTTILRDDAIAAADGANRELLEEIGNDADAILVFSCAVRHQFLGSRTKEETARLKAACNICYTGFYSYGEIGPFGLQKQIWFHTNTYIVIALREGSP